MSLLINKKNFSSQSGFTLVELLVAIFGFGLIIWGLIGLMSNIFFSSGQQAGLLSDADQARKLAFQIAKELRNGQTGSNGGYVLDTAGDQQLIFYSNADTDTAVEKIRYYVQGGKLFKGVTEYAGGTYASSTEKTWTVQNNLANGSGPIFQYYTGAYTGAGNQTPLTQPVNVTAVKMVKINLQIFNKAGAKGTNIYTVTSSSAMRNLKTNLGQ